MKSLTFFKGRNLVLWFAILGILLHIIFWFMLGTIAEAHTDRVRERIHTDPHYIPFYEMWEPEWVAAVIVMLSPCLYIPVLLAGFISLVLSDSNRLRTLIQVVGIGLGILTIIYTLLWVTSA